MIEGHRYRLTLRTKFGPTRQITGVFVGLLHDDELPDERRLDTFGFDDVRDSAGAGYGGLEVPPRNVVAVEPLP